MTFHVGQKVVCISEWPERDNVVWPSKGSVYTVRELLDVGEEPSMRLCEIRNPPMTFSNVSPREPAFVLYAFRPIVERETDIGFAHEILRKVTRKIPALAEGDRA